MTTLKVKHQLPGRVRFTIPMLTQRADLGQQLKALLSHQPGIIACKISPLTGSVLIYYQGNLLSTKDLYVLLEGLLQAVSQAAVTSSESEPRHVRKNKTSQQTNTLPIPWQIAHVSLSGLVLLALTAKHFISKTPLHHNGRAFNLCSVTTLMASYPIIRSGIQGLVHEKKLNNDLLISAATLVALFMGEGLTALVVVWLVNLSELLQSLTLDRSRRAIGELLNNKNEQAWLLVDGAQVSVPVEQLKSGDTVVVHTGAKIPVDGLVTSGSAAVNQAPITGESVPVFKQSGDTVYAGTVVEQGSIHVHTEKAGNNTALAKIIQMVEDASNKKAPIQNLADKYAEKIVPLSFLMALLIFLLTRDIHRTMTILIVACPCAAGLATPTAISAAMGNAASRGILIKGGCYLEAAGHLDTVLFDKTGTLTEGRPQVSTYVSVDEGYTPEQILALAAAGEMYTNHPLAQAVVDKARENVGEIPQYQDKKIIIGKGLKFDVGQEAILIGNHRLMEDEAVDYGYALHFAEEMSARGESIIYIAKSARIIGLIGVRDALRKQSPQAIQELKRSGIKELGLVSGDNRDCTTAVGSSLGLTDIWSNMLPEDKVKVVQEKQGNGKIVAMVGEGINDSPALAAADIGIAMGVKGTDVAVESADVVLAGDDPIKVAEMIHLSKKTMQVIHQNFAFAIGANVLGITLGTMKIISPFTSALLHNASTLAVV